MSAPGASPEPAIRQEPDAMDRRKIALVTIASLVVMALALVAAWVLLERWERGRRDARAVASAAPRTIGILEQAPILGPGRGLDLRARQEADLHRFGWVDRDAGIARIPIEDAIDLFVDAPPPPDRPPAPRAETGDDRTPAKPLEEGR